MIQLFKKCLATNHLFEDLVIVFEECCILTVLEMGGHEKKKENKHPTLMLDHHKNTLRDRPFLIILFQITAIDVVSAFGYD